MIVILEQDNRLPRCLQGELAVLRAVVHRVGDLRITDHLWRVKHPQTEAGFEQPLDSNIDVSFADQALLHSFYQRGTLHHSRDHNPSSRRAPWPPPCSLPAYGGGKY